MSERERVNLVSQSLVQSDSKMKYRKFIAFSP